jgi:LysM repeat protein
MTSITHPKAQSLLQMAADHALTSFDTANLSNHLAECEECREYAKNLTTLQDDLRRITRERWSQAKLKISAKEIKSRAIRYDFQVFGKFATATVVLAFMFIMATNFSGIANNLPAVVSSSVVTPNGPLLTPTPLISQTATNLAVSKCNNVTYLVRENDTLDDIAARNSVSVETIKQLNGLHTNTLTVNMALIIPICNQMPANSTVTPTLTSTATP